MLLKKYILSKSFRTNILLILLSAIFLLLMLFFFLRSITQYNSSIILPDFTTKTISEIKNEMTNLNLDYNIIDSSTFNPDYKINAIINQIPKPNSEVKPGRKIYFTLNASDYKKIKVPKLRGVTIREARNEIESMGFKFGQISYVNDIALNVVISVTHKGEKIYEGDFLKKSSIIDLVLGNGK